MHQVAFKFECVEVQRTLECAENGSERLWAGILVRVQAEAERGKIARGDILITEAAHVNRHELGELAAEVLNVDASATVNMRREFICEEEYIHFPRSQVRLPSVGRTAAHG